MKKDPNEELRARVGELIKLAENRMSGAHKEYADNVTEMRPNKATKSARDAKYSSMPTPIARPRITQQAAQVAANIRAAGSIFAIRAVGETARHANVERALQRMLDISGFGRAMDRVILDCFFACAGVARVWWLNKISDDDGTKTASYIGNMTGDSYVGPVIERIRPSDMICYPAEQLNLAAERLVGHMFTVLEGDFAAMITKKRKKSPEGWFVTPGDLHLYGGRPDSHRTPRTDGVLEQVSNKGGISGGSVSNPDRVMYLYDLVFRGEVSGVYGAYRMIVDPMTHAILFISSRAPSYVAITRDRTVQSIAEEGATASEAREIEKATNAIVNTAISGMTLAMKPLILTQGMSSSQLPSAFSPGTITPLRSIGNITTIAPPFNGQGAMDMRSLGHQYCDASTSTPDTIAGQSSGAVQSATAESIKAQGFKIASADVTTVVGDGLIEIAKCVIDGMKDNWDYISAQFDDMPCTRDELMVPLVISLASVNVKDTPEARTQDAMMMLNLVEKIPGLAQVVSPMDIAEAIISEMPSEFASGILEKVRQANAAISDASTGGQPGGTIPINDGSLQRSKTAPSTFAGATGLGGLPVPEGIAQVPAGGAPQDDDGSQYGGS